MIVHQLEQGTPEWSKLRRGIPTGSNADRIITPAKGEVSKSANDYAYQLVAERMLPEYYWLETSDYKSEAMEHGTNTESEARAFFELDTELSVVQVGFVTTDDARAGCSPDGLIVDELCNPVELLELKCPQARTQIKYLLDDKLPTEYRPQVHWSLVVTGLPACWFMSYCHGLPPLLLKVERDEYTEKVREAMDAFLRLVDDLQAKLEQRDFPRRIVHEIDQATNAF